MCGIFGIIVNNKTHCKGHVMKQIFTDLFVLSESRGKEASGISFMTGSDIYIVKYSLRASHFLKTREYNDLFTKFEANKDTKDCERFPAPICTMGHSRLVTNGTQLIRNNNQPVVSDDMVAIHNGIITNTDELYKQFPAFKKKTMIDTEVLLYLIRFFFNKYNSLYNGIRTAYSLIEGVASIAVQFADINCFLLTTNNGSLYICHDKSFNTLIFASEKYILEVLLKKYQHKLPVSDFSLSHIAPRTGLLIDLGTMEPDHFVFDQEGKEKPEKISSLPLKRNITDISTSSFDETIPAKIPGQGPYLLSPNFIDEFPKNKKRISQLRRCTCCVLPETMPFISFDENGMCNFCHNYSKTEPLGLDKLMAFLEPYRNKNGGPDCLISFSGGRDSSYGVHYAKNILKMNPVTYTYDWGMVTDLARRNQMRICGKLGIEHILVSADISKKRTNIRKNVLAWLKKPDLGTIPLFMAGDKQYFYYANKISRQTGCEIIFLCENPLETTRFKSGFCGVAPDFQNRQTYNLAFLDRLTLAFYYGKKFLANSSYINSSIIDTITAYLAYYFIPHNYLDIYKYIKWDENDISPVLINEYNWETATDTTSTWRIGDGTASFYNYIYYTLAGLTENDTFRSNQIREGDITRNEALQYIEKDNQPRYESIQWYCDIIGIPFDETIKTINSAPKLYS